MYFELHIDVKKFVCGGWVVHLDYNISSGPFLSFDIGVGPGPKLDNMMGQINLKAYCKKRKGYQYQKLKLY